MTLFPLYGSILLVLLSSVTIGVRSPNVSGLPDKHIIKWNKSDSGMRSERIVFYNVENLFHPSNDCRKADDDFTPAGAYHWTYNRYMEKIRKIGKLFVAIGEGRLPALIGLCEIENRRVLSDLLKFSVLKYSSYRIIHKDSPDPRGIDVALLYDPNSFYPLDFNFLNVNDSIHAGFATRDILHVLGLFHDNALCHIFVNHWPSRKGGKLESQERRVAMANLLRQVVDIAFRDDPESNIIILGDFNDEPEDYSIKYVLNAGHAEMTEDTAHLFNLMHSMSARGQGTHFRINNFTEAAVLDQIIVSRSVLSGQRYLKLVKNEANIYLAPFILNKKSGMPLRTYQGLKYLGGFSDHLPVFVDIQIIASL